jgi:hypothetical protein
MEAESGEKGSEILLEIANQGLREALMRSTSKVTVNQELLRKSLFDL